MYRLIHLRTNDSKSVNQMENEFHDHAIRACWIGKPDPKNPLDIDFFMGMQKKLREFNKQEKLKNQKKINFLVCNNIVQGCCFFLFFPN